MKLICNDFWVAWSVKLQSTAAMRLLAKQLPVQKLFLEDMWAVRIAQKTLQFYIRAADATIFLKLGGVFLFRKWNTQQKKWPG